MRVCCRLRVEAVALRALEVVDAANLAVVEAVLHYEQVHHTVLVTNQTQPSAALHAKKGSEKKGAHTCMQGVSGWVSHHEQIYHAVFVAKHTQPAAAWQN